jgi:hypothetical protein
MRWVFSLLWAVMLAGLSARAQSTGVEVSLVMDESVFLPGEAVLVGVRIANLSGRALTFGTTTNWLNFHLETKRGAIIDRQSDVPVVGQFTLEATQVGTKWWNIQPYFDFEKPGAYVVHVEMRLPEWDEQLLSDGLTFTVQGARKTWEVAIGVPPGPGQSHEAPEIRRYALQTATRRDGRKLYARVTDESETQIYRVVLLDRMLSFDNREQQVDAASRLHVLFQTGGITYTYCVLNPNGDLVIRERHDITSEGRPRLAKDAEGLIQVAGGRRVPTISDIPPYVAPPAAAIDPSATSSVATNVTAETSKKGKPSRAERRRQRQAESP